MFTRVAIGKVKVARRLSQPCYPIIIAATRRLQANDSFHLMLTIRRLRHTSYSSLVAGPVSTRLCHAGPWSVAGGLILMALGLDGRHEECRTVACMPMAEP